MLQAIIAVSILHWTVLNVVSFWDSTLNTKIWAFSESEKKPNFISRAISEHSLMKVKAQSVVIVTFILQDL